MLKLSWTIPDEKVKIASGFIVYKSKTSLSESVCKKCPVLFKQIADIPIEEKDINKKITYKTIRPSRRAALPCGCDLQMEKYHAAYT
ncbi:MAG: hypothetical protein KAU60_02230, partial [Desulfobacterales bacterium]|nr:hypothetical protein [Desulfobacterales bacterium]